MNQVYCLLIAEDDANDVFFLKRAFQEAEIHNQLHFVHDGQEAIDYLSATGKFSDRARYPLPALLILDLKMPRKTGMEVLKWLAEQPELRRLPVVVFTSSAHQKDVERAYDLGANAFVVKPSSNGRRVDLAKVIKGFWLEFNEPSLVSTDGLEAARKALSDESDGSG
jgi:CheY-like chemotaxis protein